MDKLIELLSGIAASIQEAIETLKQAPAEENVVPTTDPASDVPPTDDVVPPTDVPTVDEVSSDVPPSADLPTEDVPPATPEDVVPPESEDVPPVDPNGDVPPAGDVPPTPGPELPAPFDPTPLLGQIEELQKANEGLLARVKSLEEALKSAGVIDSVGSATEVGDPLPSATPQNPTDDVLSNVLSEINGKRRF